MFIVDLMDSLSQSRLKYGIAYGLSLFSPFHLSANASRWSQKCSNIDTAAKLVNKRRRPKPRTHAETALHCENALFHFEAGRSDGTPTQGGETTRDEG